MRPLTPLSLNMAMIATGSVAAMSTPNISAAGSGQPSSHTMPQVTAAAAITVPSVESTKMGRMSRHNSRHASESAASNSSGGRIRSKTKSCVSGNPRPDLETATPMPTTTRPTVYGKLEPARGDRNDHRDSERCDQLP